MVLLSCLCFSYLQVLTNEPYANSCKFITLTFIMLYCLITLISRIAQLLTQTCISIVSVHVNIFSFNMHHISQWWEIYLMKQKLNVFVHDLINLISFTVTCLGKYVPRQFRNQVYSEIH